MQLEDVSHFGNFSSENLVINQSTNSMKMLSVPPSVDKAHDCSNSENTQSLLCKIKLTNPQLTKNNIFSYDNSLIHNSSHTYGSPSKMGRSLNEDDARNKLKSRTGCTLPNDCTRDTVNQNVILEKLHNGTPPKRFNGNLKKESAQRNSSVICVETLNQDSSFHNENNAYLDSLGDGSQLSSRKCVRKTKPDVKLKSQQIKEKLKTALASPVYEQCLQTIKLEPIKIKKALSSINRVCKARTIEQFRTFSHLKRIMPSGKNSPHRTRVSCSVNTGAKSACIKSWNKVPFRYQSRKCFFPLSGSRQAESGLVLSDSPYKTLRATFNQNGLDTSPIQFQESDFITTDTPYQSAVEIGELNDEGFAALETDIYEGQQNGSLPSPNANSPWDSSLMNGNQPDSGYLSNYDRDGGHQQQTSTMRGSPISSTCSPESWDNIVDHQEPELLKPASIHREDSSQIILLFPKDLNRRENGINGMYKDYNREQNQGCIVTRDETWVLSCHLKTLMFGRHSGTDEEVETTVNNWLLSQVVEFYEEDIEKLVVEYVNV
ncbi:hypothetical protein AVEN_255906-1 [Araneus ventricosus]|uniref:Uncharacterized protein n=1 Tax=Araneus ventricosus TaxID=182803 RepID=A0A4Y2PAZ2_ARAVE|nr:hypothetical protein AVEN_255906-1 [Araneus ventricosus]